MSICFVWDKCVFVREVQNDIEISNPDSRIECKMMFLPGFGELAQWLVGIIMMSTGDGVVDEDAKWTIPMEW